MNDLASDQAGYFNVTEYTIRGGGSHYALEANCPCGCGDPMWLPLVPSAAQKTNDHDWVWDGNKQAPTLSLSIRRTHGCKFHGYLQAGVWSSAGDGAPVSAQVYRGGPHHPVEPRRDLMADEKPTPAPEPSKEAEKAAAPAGPPPGATKTHHLKFIDGVLHQAWHIFEDGVGEVAHWFAVPGQEKPAAPPTVPPAK